MGTERFFEDGPTFAFASREAWDLFWVEFAKIGPRHRNVARWRHDLGWTIDPRAEREYLAPEIQ